MNGGYSMIDYEGKLDLSSSEAQEIVGIYNKVDKAFNSTKPIIACNLMWDGTPATPCNVFVVQFTNYYVCSFGTLQVVVTNGDVATVNSLV